MENLQVHIRNIINVRQRLHFFMQMYNKQVDKVSFLPTTYNNDSPDPKYIYHPIAHSFESLVESLRFIALLVYVHDLNLANIMIMKADYIEINNNNREAERMFTDMKTLLDNFKTFKNFEDVKNYTSQRYNESLQKIHLLGNNPLPALISKKKYEKMIINDQ